MKKQGFTLIEVIIYTALFSIMMGSLIVVVFQLIQSAEKLTLHDSAQEEMIFVLKKIDWALIDADKIILPLSENSKILEINKNNFSDNPIIIKLNESDPIYPYVEFCVKETLCNPITTKNIIVKNLSFTHLPAIRKSPEGILLEIEINNIKIITTKYLNI